MAMTKDTLISNKSMQGCLDCSPMVTSDSADSAKTNSKSLRERMEAAEQASMNTPIKYSLQWKDNTFIKESELKIGTAYLWEDGSIKVYLGTVLETGELLFYATGKAILGSLGSDNNVVFVHGDVQLDIQKMLANMLMAAGCPLDKNAIFTYHYIIEPRIYGKLFDVYTPDMIKTWVKAHNWGFDVTFKENIDIL